MTVHRALPGRRAQQARPGWQELTAPRAASVQRDLQAHRVHKGLPARRVRTDKQDLLGPQALQARRGRALPALLALLGQRVHRGQPAQPGRQERSQV